MEVASVKGQTQGQVKTLLNKKTDPSLEKLFSLPEKVIQFGTGVLLRGLPDYFIDKANKKGLFNGRIVVVKSTDSGDSSLFSKQDNLYTLCVRGVEDGSLVEENIICASISRVLSAKSEWNEILKCASNPDFKIIISNTTEVGIELVQDDITQNPPISFPGKVLAFLYERYRHFKGAPDKGMVIVPTELIPDNGKKLESIVIELAHRNGLEGAFIDWMEQSNHFCNSLVDRIVPGTPDSKTKERLEDELGYKDDLLTVSEVYRLWAIEGNENIREVLSFAGADEGVIIEPSIEIYRELKLRLLNGAHTLTCGLAYLSGINTVKDGMDNPELASFIKNLMLAEIAPSIPYKVDEKAARRFALKTFERFQNKHIEHQWINITVQYSSKMKMRNLPLLLNYYKIFDSVPAYFVLGFSAYLLFMKGVKKENGKIYGQRGEEFYVINDSMAEYFYEKWQNTDPSKIVVEVLKDKNFWGTDLTLLPGLAEKVNVWLKKMMEVGAAKALNQFSIRA